MIKFTCIHAFNTRCLSLYLCLFKPFSGSVWIYTKNTAWEGERVWLPSRDWFHKTTTLFCEDYQWRHHSSWGGHCKWAWLLQTKQLYNIIFYRFRKWLSTQFNTIFHQWNLPSTSYGHTNSRPYCSGVFGQKSAHTISLLSLKRSTGPRHPGCGHNW